jgi:hypothetical protein
MEKPSYYGILPANVRYDKRLKPMEKILYSEITALANVYGYCYAGNSYFGELYEVHKNTVGVWINNLIKFGYLKVELIYKEDSKEVLERRLYIVDLKSVSQDPINENIDTPPHKNVDTPSTKTLTPYQQKNGYPINEIIEDNTTRTNTTSKNTTRDNTTTKLDKVNKIEQEEVSEKSSSSFVFENSLENFERDRELNEIILALFEFGVSDKTIENVVNLNVTAQKVNLVLKSAKEKGWGEEVIYKALRDNWVIEEKRENIHAEELEDKKKWLEYFAGLNKVTHGEVLEIIKTIPLEILEKNRKKLTRLGSIFEFKQELRRLIRQ